MTQSKSGSVSIGRVDVEIGQQKTSQDIHNLFKGETELLECFSQESSSAV